jgi:dihydroorotase
MKYLIKNAQIVNEGKSFVGSVLINNKIIEKIYSQSEQPGENADVVINAEGKYLIPGMIDDQVHFREPGLTHKADIYTESKAAVAGGITSFMEMPNTIPNTLTQELLEEKYQIAAKKSLANYSFYMGVSNNNLEEVLKTNPRNVCGIKVFMGSSTGNMLVDDEHTLSKLFAQSPTLIATHCEDEQTIRANTEKYKKLYGENLPVRMHPEIRNAEACFKSSSFAVELAKKHGTRLHILHISTEIETTLFDNKLPLKDKKITAEACVHHLWFTDDDYDTKGTFIKWNPAVKSAKDREAVFNAVLNDKIDVIATDHAPHTKQEKQNTYFKAPSGGPLVQHALVSLFEHAKNGKISVEKIVEKTAHNPAILFEIEKRGFIREGYFADLVLVNPNNKWTVTSNNILYKCGWSPFEGYTFSTYIEKTFVNGHLVYNAGEFDESKTGERLHFDRKV